MKGRYALTNTSELLSGFLTSQLPKTAPNKGEGWNKIITDVQKLIVPGVSN